MQRENNKILKLLRGFTGMYKKLPVQVKASVWFTISSVIQKGIALLSTPIFTRLMIPEQYGVYSVYQSWYGIITIFATLHLYAGVYNNGMTKWPDKRPEFTSAMQGLSTTITAILFAVYICFRDFWNNAMGLSTMYVLAMFIEVLFVPAYRFWASGQRYDYKYTKLVAVSVLIGVMSPVIGILTVISTEYKAEARVLSYVMVQVIVGMIIYIYNMTKGKKFYIKKYWRFALAFNIPLIPHYLSQTILNQADRIMIADMVGRDKAAIYSVAYTISMMFTIVTEAVNGTFIPYTYKAIKEKNYSALNKNAGFLVIMVGGFCIVAMAFGPEIIRFFAAPEYYEARWIVPPVAEALFFMFLYPLFCNIEFYFEKTKFIMIASSAAAAANIILNYFAIKMFGYIAAGYTTLMCYILLSFAHYLFYCRIKKQYGIEAELYNIKLLVGLSAASLAVMVFIVFIYDYIIIRYAIIAVFTLAFLWKRKLIAEKFKELKKK